MGSKSLTMFLWLLLKLGIFSNNAAMIFFKSSCFVCRWIFNNVYWASLELNIECYSEEIIDFDVDFIMIMEYIQTINWAFNYWDFPWLDWFALANEMFLFYLFIFCNPLYKIWVSCSKCCWKRLFRKLLFERILIHFWGSQNRLFLT